jgi:tetratricopeptide (TPR) repeat protein
MDDLLEDLKSAIGRKDLLIVVGAGVSLATTQGNDLASWQGLLRHGVQRCSSVCQPLPERWTERLLAQIESGDMVELLAAADNISRRLGGSKAGEYGRWLSDTVGSLTVTDPAVIDAVKSLGAPIFTTNYDTLIELRTGLSAVTWTNGSRVQAVLRGMEAAVVHLHGCWQEPQSVVLGISSYENVLRDELTQAILRDFFLARTVLLVGFGAGLRDPNFKALLQWAAKVLKSSRFRHFRLVTKSEVDRVQGEHSPEQRIFALSYGDTHGDLPAFLTAISPPAEVAGAPAEKALQQFKDNRAAIYLRLAELQAEKDRLQAAEYLQQLRRIAADLWQTGARRTAWILLSGPFRNESSKLDSNSRLQIGLLLATMMRDDAAPDQANSILQLLLADAQTLSPGSVERASFLQFQAQVFADLCAYEEAVNSLRQAAEATPDEDLRDSLHAEMAELHLLQGNLDEALQAAAQVRGPS